MQDLLTLAATVTLYSLIAFIAIGYPFYVWHRTAPVPASEFLTSEELAEEGNAVELAAQVDAAMSAPLPIEAEAPASLPALFAAVDAIMTKPIYADAPATATVQRRRKASPTPIQEVITTQPKRKRGRPRKVA